MNYRFTTDQSKMSITLIHEFLSQSYWSPGVPVETVKRAMNGSLCFASFIDGQQVGFGRFITDGATFAYLADVFIVDAQQGGGVGKKMMNDAFALPEVQGLRRMMLATSTAHGLYERFGFAELSDPSMIMEKVDSTIYQE